jgi:nicotinamide-nucleotide amidase
MKIYGLNCDNYERTYISMNHPDFFDKDLIDTIKKRITTRKESISVAESVTAGLLQLALASAEDASQFFQGGVTAYNIGQKSRHLLVDPIEAIACNCVSADIAAQMAVNVCDMFKSDWGIAVTGYAAPVPESNQKLFAYYAIAHRTKVIVSRKIEIGKRTMQPISAQCLYVDKILNELSRLLNRNASARKTHA